ncbi:MAG: SDR family oxidoreductase [Ardenticatenaceae bacterium]|nr:SDR family oxidoreductase [Anaerolineales bacterium]MCB8921640.1 SDR family oxidoreductase [Ardenticatenaceae bacterium]MCB9003328.1 SDR family oxidoreductase [Ardenticatenaceae bacterium]
MFDFTNQVVLVTGASGNLGMAVAQAFQRAGANLALIGRQAIPELTTNPTQTLIQAADLTNEDETETAVRTIIDHFGRIDVLVHIVGGYRAGTPLHETPLATLDFMLNLNAKTTFITNQAVIPYMIQQGTGKIINLASRPGLQGYANTSAYSAAKAAVIRLTESAAAELRDKGINVNCILPGTIDTPQNRDAMPNADFSRWVQPASLADVILFLASPAARDIHGAAIPVYGRS